MITNKLLTAEEFADGKFEYTDGGRWVELVKGRCITLHPPDDAHGRTLLNLTKSVATTVQNNPQGYFCFELGIVVARDPDTVRSPAASFFVDGPKFGEMDEIISQRVPALVVEIISTPDRRDNVQQKVSEYQQFGVDLIWILDPHDRKISCMHSSGDQFSLLENETLEASPHWTCDRTDSTLLSGFQTPVAEFFVEPDWWNGK